MLSSMGSASSRDPGEKSKLTMSLDDFRPGHNPFLYLPTGLVSLYVTRCLLLEMPDLPSTLKILDISYNSIRDISRLPRNLEIFSCSHCLIEEIPALPPGLRYLDCANNKIKRISNLPASLTSFYACNNEITEFESDNSFVFLFMRKNRIRGVPNINTREVYLEKSLYYDFMFFGKSFEIYGFGYHCMMVERQSAFFAVIQRLRAMGIPSELTRMLITEYFSDPLGLDYKSQLFWSARLSMFR